MAFSRLKAEEGLLVHLPFSGVVIIHCSTGSSELTGWAAVRDSKANLPGQAPAQNWEAKGDNQRSEQEGGRSRNSKEGRTGAITLGEHDEHHGSFYWDLVFRKRLLM